MTGLKAPANQETKVADWHIYEVRKGESWGGGRVTKRERDGAWAASWGRGGGRGAGGGDGEEMESGEGGTWTFLFHGRSSSLT